MPIEIGVNQSSTVFESMETDKVLKDEIKKDAAKGSLFALFLMLFADLSRSLADVKSLKMLKPIPKTDSPSSDLSDFIFKKNTETNK